MSEEDDRILDAVASFTKRPMQARPVEPDNGTYVMETFGGRGGLDICTFDITPPKGYHMTNIKVNGIEIKADRDGKTVTIRGNGILKITPYASNSISLEQT